MLPDPLHPALVHFPVVLAVLVPLAALTAAFVVRRAERSRPAWLVVVVMATALAGSSWLAIATGEREEERVEEVLTSEAALSRHEERADQFLAVAVGVLGLALAGLGAGRLGRLGRAAAAVASLLLVPAGLRVGHSGGELVYVHGAAQAYTGSNGSPVATPGNRPGEERAADSDQH